MKIISIIASLVIIISLFLGVYKLILNNNSEFQSLLNDPNQWVLPTGDYKNQRFSSLKQINSKNVNQLRVAWTFSTGSLLGHHGSPLVVNDIMYISTPYPNIVYALDLNNKGKILWKYTSTQHRDTSRVLCCGRSNRGVAYLDGKIYLHRADTTLVALDALSGKLIWSTTTGNVKNGESNTTSILPVKDRIIIGVAGGELGVRGYLSAYHKDTGRLLWQGYSTGPDQEMLIDPNKTTVLGSPVGKDSSLKSWEGDQWKLGGGTTWGWYSLDIEENLIYYGTGNPGVWNPLQRPGDNKWSNSIIARDIDTGIVRWLYQLTPADEWDYDGVNEMILLEQEINGKSRKILVHFDRNGFVYTLDRITGELIDAKKFAQSTNWATHVELNPNSEQYGYPQKDPTYSAFSQGENTVINNVCPSALGAKNQQPASFSQKDQLFFVPTNHICMDWEVFQAKYVKAHLYLGGSHNTYAVRDSHGGAGNLIAWNNSNGKIVWTIPETFPVWSGVLSTAGGITFYGTFEGYLKAVDSSTGELLYKFKTPTGVLGNVMTYFHRDKQYIAVYSGIGGASNIAMAAGLTRSESPTYSKSSYHTMRQFTRGGQLTVFSLPY